MSIVEKESTTKTFSENKRSNNSSSSQNVKLCPNGSMRNMSLFGSYGTSHRNSRNGSGGKSMADSNDWRKDIQLYPHNSSVHNRYRNSNNNNTFESNNNDDNDDAGASYGEDEYSNTFSPKHSSKSNYGSSSHRNAYSSETAGAERGVSTSTRQYNVPSEAILRFRKEWIDKAEGLALEPTMVNGKLSIPVLMKLNPVHEVHSQYRIVELQSKSYQKDYNGMYYNRSHGNNSTSSRSTSKAAPYEPNLFDDEELDGSIWDSSIEANENFDIFSSSAAMEQEHQAFKEKLNLAKLGKDYMSADGESSHLDEAVQTVLENQLKQSSQDPPEDDLDAFYAQDDIEIIQGDDLEHQLLTSEPNETMNTTALFNFMKTTPETPAAVETPPSPEPAEEPTEQRAEGESSPYDDHILSIVNSVLDSPVTEPSSSTTAFSADPSYPPSMSSLPPSMSLPPRSLTAPSTRPGPAPLRLPLSGDRSLYPSAPSGSLLGLSSSSLPSGGPLHYAGPMRVPRSYVPKQYPSMPVNDYSTGPVLNPPPLYGNASMKNLNAREMVPPPDYPPYRSRDYPQEMLMKRSMYPSGSVPPSPAQGTALRSSSPSKTLSDADSQGPAAPDPDSDLPSGSLIRNDKERTMRTYNGSYPAPMTKGEMIHPQSVPSLSPPPHGLMSPPVPSPRVYVNGYRSSMHPPLPGDYREASEMVPPYGPSYHDKRYPMKSTPYSKMNGPYPPRGPLYPMDNSNGMMEMGLRYPTYSEYPPAGPLSGSSSEGALRMPMMRSDQDPYRMPMMNGYYLPRQNPSSVMYTNYPPASMRNRN